MTSSFSVPGEMTLWSLRGVGRPEAPLGIYVGQRDLGRCDAAGELLAKGPTGHQNNAAAPPPPSLTAGRGRPPGAGSAWLSRMPCEVTVPSAFY